MHRDRCSICGLLRDDCLCQEIVSLSIDTQVVIIIHYRELRQPSNTARLAHLLLANSTLHLHGQINNPVDIKLNPNRRYYTLYPHSTSQILNRDLIGSDPRPITLLVPDGSWRQARRMVKRISAFSQNSFVCLPQGPPTRYDLRRQSNQRHLSTLEAIARALGIIEGKNIQNVLERYFETMVKREMALRGLRPSWEV